MCVIFPDGEELVAYPCLCSLTQIFVEFFKNVLCVFLHAEYDLFRDGVVDVHVKVFVLLASSDADLAVDPFASLYDTGDDLWGLVGHLEIIHVPHYGHLVSANIFVGNARVVWIDSESFCVEVAPDLAVEHQCGLNKVI